MAEKQNEIKIESMTQRMKYLYTIRIEKGAFLEALKLNLSQSKIKTETLAEAILAVNKSDKEFWEEVKKEFPNAYGRKAIEILNDMSLRISY